MDHYYLLSKAEPESDGTYKLSNSDVTKLAGVVYTDVIYQKEGGNKVPVEYNVVMTQYGLMHVDLEKGTGCLLTTPFLIEDACRDEKGNCSLKVRVDEEESTIPYKGITCKYIEETLMCKGIVLYKDENSTRLIVDYLRKEMKYVCISELNPVMGWKHNKGNISWAGTSQNSKEGSKLSLNSVGSYIQELNGLIENLPSVQFVLCSAIAAILICFFKIKNLIPADTFIVGICGTSSTGKTSALKLAASMFDSPDNDLVFSSTYATDSALVGSLGRHHGVPAMFDETTINPEKTNKNNIYKLSMGKDKKRLNPDSTFKKSKTWITTILMTGESMFVDPEDDNKGLLVRIISLWNETYTRNAEHAETMKRFASENYGIISEKVAEYILKENPEKLKELFDECRERVVSAFTFTFDLSDRLAVNYAFIILTSCILKWVGVVTDTEGIIELCIKHYETLQAAVTPGKHIAFKILSRIASQKPKGVFWKTRADKEPYMCEITDSTFEDIMKSLGITDKADINKNITHMLDSGFILRQSSGRRKVRIDVDGVPTYGYRFDIAKIKNEIDGSVNSYSQVRHTKYFDRELMTEIHDVDDSNAVIRSGNYKVIDSHDLCEADISLL